MESEFTGQEHGVEPERDRTKVVDEDEDEDESAPSRFITLSPVRGRQGKSMRMGPDYTLFTFLSNAGDAEEEDFDTLMRFVDFYASSESAPPIYAYEKLLDYLTCAPPNAASSIGALLHRILERLPPWKVKEVWSPSQPQQHIQDRIKGKRRRRNQERIRRRGTKPIEWLYRAVEEARRWDSTMKTRRWPFLLEYLMEIFCGDVVYRKDGDGPSLLVQFLPDDQSRHRACELMWELSGGANGRGGSEDRGAELANRFLDLLLKVCGHEESLMQDLKKRFVSSSRTRKRKFLDMLSPTSARFFIESVLPNVANPPITNTQLRPFELLCYYTLLFAFDRAGLGGEVCFLLISRLMGHLFPLCATLSLDEHAYITQIVRVMWNHITEHGRVGLSEDAQRDYSVIEALLWQCGAAGSYNHPILVE